MICRELSGVVTQIECPKLVGKKHQYKLFTFILNNLMGQKCRVCVWNNEIEKFEPLVKPRSVSIIYFFTILEYILVSF